MRQKPTTYKGWLELMGISSQPKDIISAGQQALRLNNSKQSHHDIALILAEMYRRDMVVNQDNRIASNITKDRFNTVVKSLFNTPLDSMISYVKKVNPEYTLQKEGSLGYLKKRGKPGGLGFLE